MQVPHKCVRQLVGVALGIERVLDRTSAVTVLRRITFHRFDVHY
jgi:hypothetical protein